jgi:hypothetical protein
MLIPTAAKLFHTALSTTGMSNMRPAGRILPFASTPAARTKVTLTAKIAVFII